MKKKLVFAAILIVSFPVLAQQITEFPAPGGDFFVPNDYAPGLAAAPDGGIWYVRAGHVGRVSQSGAIVEFTVNAVDITWGPDGNLWYTGFGRIGRLTPTGSAREFPIPTAGAILYGIVAGPDGNLWYTEGSFANDQGGGPPPAPCCAVGRITTAGVAADFKLPSGVEPSALVVGPDQRLWIRLGTYRIAVDGTIQHVPTTGPTILSTGGQVLGPDGNVWFTAFAQDSVGKVTPAGVVTTYSLPVGSGPLGITTGPDGNLWLTEYTAGKIARITTSGVVTEYPTPTAGSKPKSIVTGADGNLWFVEEGAAKIGRLTLTGPGSGKVTLTVPAVASIHGLNGTFFRSDLWLMNRSPTTPAVVTLSYHRFGATFGGQPIQTVTLDPRSPVLLEDIVGSFLGAPETAGAIEISYAPGTGPVTVTSRVYTTSGGGSLGTAVPALRATDARVEGLFLGVAGSAGDLSRGFRSNVGIYNPNATSAMVSFGLYSAEGLLLGSTSRLLAALEATQLSPNIFDLVGASSVSTRNARLIVSSDVPVFSFVTVIDNQSGDSSFLTPGDNTAVP